MYSYNTIENQKLSSPPPTSQPLPFDQTPVTGIPVNPAYQLNSNIIVPRPIHPQANTVPWSSGLFDCCADVQNSGVVNVAIYALIMAISGHACLYSCFYRSKLRQQYSLEESPCGDCLVHCCCELCALCQEYRELKSRGFNMTIGWEGNVERQIHGVAMPPIVQGGMTR